MSSDQTWGGTVRKIWPKEVDKFKDHLLRLDKDSRRSRFAHGVSDSFIEEYAARTFESGSIIYGLFIDGQVRGAAGLKKLGDLWGREAEAAFSVEKPYQEHGIGSELMGRVIRAARNRGVHHLCITCLAENRKMQAIARKHEAELRFEYGEVIGDIVPEGPDYFSLVGEAVEDRFSYMMAVLDLQASALKAA